MHLMGGLPIRIFCFHGLLEVSSESGDMSALTSAHCSLGAQERPYAYTGSTIFQRCFRRTEAKNQGEKQILA